MQYLVNLKDINLSHLNSVGGKNASLGEMIQNLSAKGINIPGGYATTVDAYRQFLKQQQLEAKINKAAKLIDFEDIKSLNKVSAQIRKWILATPFFPEFETEIAEILEQFNKRTTFAIRSSATAEDLPEASFAGQQETYLNVSGLKNILDAIKCVFASLFTSRAIDYRYRHQLNNSNYAISVGIQPMIRSDKGASGVMFTLDTESGFDKVILINASYGLGEGIVQGKINPDEFYIFKPALEQNRFPILQKKLGDKSEKMIYAPTKNFHTSIKTIPTTINERQKYCIDNVDILTLARFGLIIENHYGKPMDIEWAKDGITGELYILQARPETVESRNNKNQHIEHYQLLQKGKILAQGLSIGQRIGSGKARVITDIKQIQTVKPGDVLVTDMTDPDWEPIMKKAAAIVTNRGGRTCHAAIVARELGIPAIVGCVNATTTIKNGQPITVSCVEGEKGYVYSEELPFKINKIKINSLPPLPINLCLNIGNPDKAFTYQFLPNKGVGLARLEFIISSIGVHPNSVLNLKKLNKHQQKKISKIMSGYANPIEFYLEKLREGMAKIAAAFYPKQVIFRFSDFKSNEYANLLGGEIFEEFEENPMIGFRGASRYTHERFRDCFELECKALKFIRDNMGLTNAQIMIPFVRTVDELKNVIALMESYGLKRNENQLKIFMMCEIPSNIILAKEFLNHVDGYSIGSNDLTQLALGLDRDSTIIAPLFDERNAAIKILLHNVIQECVNQNKYIGICGQGPSDYPDFAEWLMQEGIQHISLSPDTIVETWISLAKKEEPIIVGS